MYMMHPLIASHSGFLFLSAIHFIAVFLLLFGIFFLALLAARTLTHVQLKQWGIVFLVVAIILCFLEFGFGMSFRTVNHVRMGGEMEGGNMMMKQSMRGDMMEAQMGMKEDGAHGMSMNAMTEALTGLSGDAFDQAFLDLMIVHHEGAVDMARATLVSAKHDELKALAEAILTAQQKEIDQMKQWQKDWGYPKE